MKETIYAIVPFSKPQFIENVKKNFTQQKYSDKKLIIVENGDGLGTCKKHGFEPDVLLTSDSHQSWARNEAIQWVKNHGGGICANFDDDDYYGPSYLSELNDNKDKANIIGKYDFFIKTLKGFLRLFEGVCSNSPTELMHGATIALRAEEALEYKDTGKWGEDWDLLERMRAQGATMWATSKNNFMVKRYPKSTWNITDWQMVQTISFGLGNQRHKLIIKDFGTCPNEEMIADGKTEEPEFTEIIPDSNYKLGDSPAYTILMKNAPSFDDFIAQHINKSSN